MGQGTRYRLRPWSPDDGMGSGQRVLQANVLPHLVQRWLGHASLRTAIYANVSGKEELLGKKDVEPLA
jgi:hypothetical protein